MDCKLNLAFRSEDSAELLRTCEAIVEAGAVEVWGDFIIDFVGGDIHPRIDVNEFRPRDVDEFDEDE